MILHEQCDLLLVPLREVRQGLDLLRKGVQEQWSASVKAQYVQQLPVHTKITICNLPNKIEAGTIILRRVHPSTTHTKSSMSSASPSPALVIKYRSSACRKTQILQFGGQVFDIGVAAGSDVDPEQDAQEGPLHVRADLVVVEHVDELLDTEDRLTHGLDEAVLALQVARVQTSLDSNSVQCSCCLSCARRKVQSRSHLLSNERLDGRYHGQIVTVSSRLSKEQNIARLKRVTHQQLNLIVGINTHVIVLHKQNIKQISD